MVRAARPEAAYLPKRASRHVLLPEAMAAEWPRRVGQYEMVSFFWK